MDTPNDAPKLTLLTTTHRVAPGLLSWPAWSALHAAPVVLVADPAHPQLPALAQAGVTVEPVERASAPALARLLVERAPVLFLGSQDGDRG